MDIHKIIEKIYKELRKIFVVKENTDKKNRKNKYSNFLIVCLSLVLIGILFVTADNYFNNTNTTNINTSNTTSKEISQEESKNDYEKKLENKLKSILEDMEGVGKTNIMITIEGSEEQVPAINITDSNSTTKEKDNSGGTRETVQNNNGSTIVITNDGSKSQPLIVQTKKPKIIGVCVIAEGADDKIIQMQITQAVTKLYNLTPDKVSVYPMKK
ncbi:stage III sporulation protein AG [Clostridium sp. USBA 49]|uniref:stage III sporulation protein AG n=1 Tax=Clostridium TaxID=1485 RepID=UPI00099910A3|nr:MULTISPECIES: stage III sporulation protein AG [Clostridium]SKA76799.1 stage III sporulation protein AG [Clostridium sp. USBA 49]